MGGRWEGVESAIAQDLSIFDRKCDDGREKSDRGGDIRRAYLRWKKVRDLRRVSGGFPLRIEIES